VFAGRVVSCRATAEESLSPGVNSSRPGLSPNRRMSDFISTCDKLTTIDDNQREREVPIPGVPPAHFILVQPHSPLALSRSALGVTVLQKCSSQAFDRNSTSRSHPKKRGSCALACHRTRCPGGAGSWIGPAPRLEPLRPNNPTPQPRLHARTDAQDGRRPPALSLDQTGSQRLRPLVSSVAGLSRSPRASTRKTPRRSSIACSRPWWMALLKYEGRVDRFLGDGVLAVFGAPLAHEDDPERAMLRRWRRLRSELPTGALSAILRDEAGRTLAPRSPRPALAADLTPHARKLCVTVRRRGFRGDPRPASNRRGSRRCYCCRYIRTPRAKTDADRVSLPNNCHHWQPPSQLGPRHQMQVDRSQLLVVG
jgi:hypothetical protein